MKYSKIVTTCMTVFALTLPTALLASDKQQIQQQDQTNVQDCVYPNCPDDKDPNMKQKTHREQDKNQALGEDSSKQEATSGGSDHSGGGGKGGGGGKN